MNKLLQKERFHKKTVSFALYLKTLFGQIKYYGLDNYTFRADFGLEVTHIYPYLMGYAIGIVFILLGGGGLYIVSKGENKIFKIMWLFSFQGLILLIGIIIILGVSLDLFSKL
jgi:hypothetical protein